MSLENQFINILYNNYNIKPFLNKNPLIFIDYFFNTSTNSFKKLSKLFYILYETDELYLISVLKTLNNFINPTNANTFIKLFTTTIDNIQLVESICDYIKYPDLKSIYFYALLKQFNYALVINEELYYLLTDVITFNKTYMFDPFTLLQRNILSKNYNVVKLIVNNHTITDSIYSNHSTKFLLYTTYPDLLNDKDIKIYNLIETIKDHLIKNIDIDYLLSEIDTSLYPYNSINNTSLICYANDKDTLYKLINKGCDFNNYNNRSILMCKNQELLISNGIYMSNDYFMTSNSIKVYKEYRKELYDIFIGTDLIIKDIVNYILKYI